MVDIRALGYLGECLVKAELAKRNIRCVETTPYLNFDLVGTNSNGEWKRIEVKTSLGSARKSSEWHFRVKNRKACDVVICVGFRKPSTEIHTLEELPEPVFFIIPPSEIPESGSFVIPFRDTPSITRPKGSHYYDYLNKWELLGFSHT